MKTLTTCLLALFLSSNAIAQTRDSFTIDPAERGRTGSYPVREYQREPAPAAANVARPDPAPMRTADGQGWRPVYLLSGPAAIFKGVGASLWCIGDMSATLYSDVDSVGKGFTATFLWAPAVIADSFFSTLAYAVVGVAHTISFGFLVSDPPKKIEDITAPIHCIISDYDKD